MDLDSYAIYKGISLVAQIVKNLTVMQETLVQSLGQEDPLEKGMATHSSVLAWRTPQTEFHCNCPSLDLTSAFLGVFLPSVDKLLFHGLGKCCPKFQVYFM